MSTPEKTRRTGRSAYTPHKDSHMPLIGQKVLAASKNAMRATWTAYRRIVVFDLTAGFGIAPDGRLSVVVPLLDWVAREGVAVDAFLCEADARAYRTLTRVMADRYDATPDLCIMTHHGDCRTLAPTLIADLSRRSRGMGGDGIYGLILVDPCGLVPWDAVRTISRAYPRLDVLMNVGAATIKWFRPSLGLATLDQEIDLLGKTTRLISKPQLNYQWVMLLLSNFPYGRSVTHELELIDTSPGREWWERAKKTRAEIKAHYQPSLWPELQIDEGEE
jgi:three-Cys-motif partner protein